MPQWYENKELSAGYLRLRMLHRLYKLLGATALKVAVVPVCLVTYLFARRQRMASYRYFEQLQSYTGDEKYKPSFFKSFRHFLGFALSLVDRLQAWSGVEMPIEKDEIFREMHEHVMSKRGVFLLSAHIGNMELLRGVAQQVVPVNVFMDVEHAQEFGNFINSINPQANLKVWSTLSDIGVHTAVMVKEKTDAGEVVVMAADRLPSPKAKAVEANFLGGKIHLPVGAIKLAMLSEADIYSCFICREGKKYRLSAVKYPPGLSTKEYAALFAAEMEKATLAYPYQWFNFYDYWK
jgi:predicted LPLAT superfamily acyltransferase